MPFQKGHKKTGGRKKKTPNIITQEKREKLSEILAVGLTEIPEVMERIKADKPEVYVKLMLEMASFVVPKKKDITSDDQSIVPNVTITENRDQSE